jgi:hypothetical protein
MGKPKFSFLLLYIIKIKYVNWLNSSPRGERGGAKNKNLRLDTIHPSYNINLFFYTIIKYYYLLIIISYPRDSPIKLGL